MTKVASLVCGALVAGSFVADSASGKPIAFQQGSANVLKELPTLSTGIAMSGGGSRSASSAMGQYRALGELVQEFDSISSVSGGTWASSIYMFAQGTDEYLLGAATRPSDLNSTVLNDEPGALGAVLTAHTERIAAEITAKKYVLSGKDIYNLDLFQLWQATVGAAFLKPFNLDSNQYLAQDTASVSAIIANNPDLGLSAKDFLVPRTDRPKEYIMGSTLLAPQGYHATQDTVGFMHFTPSYSGVVAGPIMNEYPSALSLKAKNMSSSPAVMVGGGMVETFAFGSTPPSDADLPISFEESADSESSPVQVSVGIPTGKNNKFTLADATGASSAAFGAATAQVELTSHVDPQIQYWSPYLTNTSQSAPKMMLGDGGNSEDTGVVALLQRNVQRIASFINTDEPLDMSKDLCDPVFYDSNSSALQGAVTSQFVGLFQGYAPVKADGTMYVNDDAVFPHDDLYEVLCTGQKLVRQGKPFVVKASHLVMPNARWGIKGGWNVTVVWNLLTVVQDFQDQLPLDTQQEIALGKNGTLANFPYFKTMYQNGDNATAYTYPQINLLSAQTEYAVEQNIELYASLLTAPTLSPTSSPISSTSSPISPTSSPTASSAGLSKSGNISLAALSLASIMVTLIVF